MKAAVLDRYGPPEVVRVGEVPTPTPTDTDVLVRVRAVAVTTADARIRAARFPSGFGPLARLMFGITRPRRAILGTTFAGVVESVGAKTDGLRPGDAVCGMTGLTMGAHADFVAVPARRVVRTPAAVTHTDAAAVLFGGTAALHFLRDRAHLGPDDTLLVNGASGALGTNAVQLAKHLGAHVTAVASTTNTDLVTSLGADRVIDYTATDLHTLPDRFDAVFDTVGTLTATAGRRLLTDRGILLLAVAGLWDTAIPRTRVATGSAPESPADFEYLLNLVADGVLTPVTQDLDGLDRITEAYTRVDSGHKVGNIVVHV